jgi:hypothetical protein
MSNRLVIGAALALGIAWSGSALAAEGPMPAGTFALSGDRLMGVFHTTTTVSSGALSVDQTIDNFALLGMQSTGPYDLPRIGMDGFVIDGLSLGGSLYVAHRSIDSNVGAGPVGAAGSQSATDFLIAPRVGYALMFTDSIGFWPRGGFTYFHETLSPNGSPDISIHYISLGLDVPFIFALTNGFAITVGPVLDIAVDGSAKQDGSNVDVTQKYTSFGLTAGLMGWI